MGVGANHGFAGSAGASIAGERSECKCDCRCECECKRKSTICSRLRSASRARPRVLTRVSTLDGSGPIRRTATLCGLEGWRGKQTPPKRPCALALARHRQRRTLQNLRYVAVQQKVLHCKVFENLRGGCSSDPHYRVSGNVTWIWGPDDDR